MTIVFDAQAALLHKRFLHGESSSIFQVFPEKRTEGAANAFSDTFAHCVPRIAQAVARGLAVCIAINTFKSTVRKRENVKAIKAFFADFDGGVTLDQIKALALPPQFITETSPEHYHALWRVKDCPIDQYSAIQKALAKKLGSDQNVSDVTRAMRLAGTINRKHSKPHLVRIVFSAKGKTAAAIPVRTFCEAFGIDLVKKAAPAIPAPVLLADPTQDITDVKLALTKIPARERQTWLMVGMALHSFLPTNEGKALWDEWSRTAADTYDEVDQNRTWGAFKPNGGVGRGTIFYLAKQHSSAGTTNIPCTESGLATLFVETYSEKVAYDHGSANWYVFDGTWKKQPHVAQRLCKAMLENLANAARQCNPNGKNELVKALRRYITTSGITNILRFASLEPAIETTASMFDNNPNLLGVGNGVIELCRGLHRPFQAADRITLQCTTNFERNAKCPAFLSFLASITDNDSEYISYLRRAFGYSLFGHTKEQVFFMIVGPGANGKGVLLRTICKVLGAYGRTVAPNLLQRAYASNPNAPSPAVMALKAARLYACTEFDGERRFDAAFIKQLSGSDPLTGRSNFGDQETFMPTGKLWLSLNFEPEIAYDDEAMWRRVTVIPLPRSFLGKDRDHELEAKLAAELPGILNWLIEGAVRYTAEGLGTCAKVMDATKTLRGASDTVRSWLRACCSKVEGATLLPASEVYRHYVAFTRDGHHTPLSITKFTAALKRFKVNHVRRSSGNFWKGLRIRNM